jgi:hypothetical protein
MPQRMCMYSSEKHYDIVVPLNVDTTEHVSLV